MAPKVSKKRPNDDANQLAYSTLLASILAAPVEIQQEENPSVLNVNMMSSQIVAIKLKGGKTFHIHSSLLCLHSEMFRVGLQSQFNEAQSLVWTMENESADHFSKFVEFLYASEWKPACKTLLDRVVLVQLYALGERLLSRDFQKRILLIFVRGLENNYITAEVTCQMLRIACNDITECTATNTNGDRGGDLLHDDPMRSTIIALATSRLDGLQKRKEFHQMLDGCKGLAKKICLSAGNTKNLDWDDFLPEDARRSKKARTSASTGIQLLPDLRLIPRRSTGRFTNV